MLLDHTRVHDDNAIGERHTLDLIERDINHGIADRHALCEFYPDLGRDDASRLESGSSKRNMRGLRASARPIATRWR